MKTRLFSRALSILLSCAGLCLACGHHQVQQFTVDLQYGDGSKESYAMYPGSILLVNDGNMHAVAKVISGTASELELQVTTYSMTRDSLKGVHTLRKAGGQTHRLAMAKPVLLDPSGTVQVHLQAMAMIDTGRQPRGACQGNCCEAKCFSTYCCADPDECKNVPCDCKPPAGCPTPPSGQIASHFFELFLSGKDMMVFTN